MSRQATFWPTGVSSRSWCMPPPPPLLCLSLSCFKTVLCIHRPRGPASALFIRGGLGPKGHGRSYQAVSSGVATWRGKLKKSQRGAFRISGLSFGAPLTARLDPWLWANTEGPWHRFLGSRYHCGAEFWVLGPGCCRGRDPVTQNPTGLEGRRLIELSLFFPNGWIGGWRAERNAVANRQGAASARISSDLCFRWHPASQLVYSSSPTVSLSPSPLSPPCAHPLRPSCYLIRRARPALRIRRAVGQVSGPDGGPAGASGSAQ